LHGIIGEVLVEVFVVNLDHGGVGARSKALHFLKSEETVSTGLAILNVRKVFDSLHDVLSSSEHARSGSTDLEVVLADLSSVEHGVETGYFIHLHGSHL